MKKKFFSLILLPALLAGCVNLKHVSELASSSSNALNMFENVHYSYKQNCLERCETEKIINYDLTLDQCDCKNDEEADKVTSLIHNRLIGYFKALSSLSKDELTKYNTDDLATAIAQSNVAGVDANVVSSYSKISKKLLDAFTDEYRKNKLKIYITEANPDIQILLKALSDNHASLSGKINVQKQRLQSQFFDLGKDRTLSQYERNSAIAEYFSKIKEMNSKQASLEAFSKGLAKIAKAHHDLATDIKKISKKEVKNMLFKYATELDEIVSEFNKLKSK